jgi:DNA-binding winged helix-turn-helix (wHTH) protein
MPAAIEYLFGHCHLFPAERRLLAAGAPVKLGGRAFDLLVVLVERRERTVSKAELIERVWPNLVVEENNLQVQVAALRKLLGHPAIATVPGRGYRFALPVRVCGEVGHEAAGAADETGSSGSSGSSASSGSALPPSAPVPLPLGLRERLPVLFGRADDVRAVQALLAEHGFVSIVGPGGVGKTRLAEAVACEAAAERADAAWWVDLAPLSQASLLPAALAAALRLAPAPGPDPAQRVLAELARREGLVVLDNAEHLLEQVAAFAVELRRHAPRVRLLVTSQAVLRAAGECVFRATPLALPAQDDPAAVAARRWRSSSRARRRPTAASRSGPATPARWPRCAAAWTACRWPSNWRPRAWRCWAWRACALGSTSGCAC